MPLEPGTTLGPYSVTAKIGEGGMGEVWQARDTKLDRDVALKVLPEAFTSDPDRLARFEREAKVLASLNHPNIGSIYGLEEAEGVKALVLELVEGPTLADRIKQGPIPLDEALPIATQIAEALEAAHEAGVIHRDLKPANVKVKDDGTVKVLDFGLAKAFQPEASDPNMSQSPTVSLTAAATQMGMVIGTAAYMSPEQARGKPLDKRTDIWAFGVVLYEMLTGRRAFDSEDLSLTLADVMRADPAWDRLPAVLSPSAVTYLKRCLQKDPKDRVRDIGDVRMALGGAFETKEPSTSAYHGPVPLPPGFPLWRRVLPSASLAIALAGVVGLTVWVMTQPGPGTVATFVLTTTPEASPTFLRRGGLAIAPDGTVAYETLEGIYRRRVGEVDPTPVQGAGSAFSPFFSPDGRWLGFFDRDLTLKQVSVLGGAPSTIAQVGNSLFGASWGPGDSIVLGSNTEGLVGVSATGGTLEPLTQVGAEGESHRWPSVLPNGRGVLFTVWSGGLDTARIAVLSLETGEVTDLVNGGTSPRCSPTGHLVYAAGGTLRAVGFDADRLTVTSDAALPVLENVLVTAAGSAYFGIADTGTLVYLSPQAAAREVTLALVDPAGQAEALGVPTSASYNYPRVSPDGDRVAYTARYTDGDDIAVYEIGSDTAPLRLTFGGGSRYQVWSADGHRIMFQSERDGFPGIFSQSIDGAGAAERLTTPAEGERHIPDSASSDGAWLSFTVVRDQVSEVWRLALASGETEPLVVAPGAQVAQSVFSPNAQWLAYQSNETGEDEIFVQPFPPTGAKYQVPSTLDNHHPIWAPDGRSLFYVPGPRLFAHVSVATEPTFRFGNPVSLNLNRAGRTGPPTELRRLDMMPDGERFVGVWPENLIGASAEVSDDRLIVVLNWFEELRQRVPVP